MRWGHTWVCTFFSFSRAQLRHDTSFTPSKLPPTEVKKGWIKSRVWKKGWIESRWKKMGELKSGTRKMGELMDVDRKNSWIESRCSVDMNWLDEPVDMSRVWISTAWIGNPAFHLWSGYVDHTVWETTGVIGDQGADEKKKSWIESRVYKKIVELRAG